MLLPRDQKKAIYSFSPPNKWPDGATEQHDGVVPQSIYQLREDDWAKLLLMTKFAYNNAKNTNTGHLPFKLNYGYHSKMSFEENVDSHSKSCSTDKQVGELKKLMEVYCQNLLHAQELQKKAYDKEIKSRSYGPGEKVWLNSKYIKTKKKKKLESKFFGPFRVLYTVEKQAYKLELLIK